MALAFIKELDTFGNSTPSFNIGGQTVVKTLTGAFVTLTMYSLMLAFTSLKLEHLIIRKNPVISTNMVPLELGSKYDTDSDEFMMAFSAENYDNGEALSDPRFVRWLFGVWSREGSSSKITYHLMHKCNDEEFARFEKTNRESVGAKVKRL